MRLKKMKETRLTRQNKLVLKQCPQLPLTGNQSHPGSAEAERRWPAWKCCNLGAEKTEVFLTSMVFPIMFMYGYKNAPGLDTLSSNLGFRSWHQNSVSIQYVMREMMFLINLQTMDQFFFNSICYCKFHFKEQTKFPLPLSFLILDWAVEDTNSFYGSLMTKMP